MWIKSLLDKFRNQISMQHSYDDVPFLSERHLLESNQTEKKILFQVNAQSQALAEMIAICKMVRDTNGHLSGVSFKEFCRVLEKYAENDSWMVDQFRCVKCGIKFKDEDIDGNKCPTGYICRKCLLSKKSSKKEDGKTSKDKALERISAVN